MKNHIVVTCEYAKQPLVMMSNNIVEYDTAKNEMHMKIEMIRCLWGFPILITSW